MNTPKLNLVNPETFKNVRSAGAFLSQNAGIDLYNASDCIYKALRPSNKSHSTHGYFVERGADKQIILSRIVKETK